MPGEERAQQRSARGCGGPCGSGGASERRTRSERRRQATAARHANRERKTLCPIGRRNTKCPARNPSTPSTPREKARPLASIGKSGVVAMRNRRERRLTILIVGALTTLLHPGWMVGQSHATARRSKARIHGARRRALSLSRRPARLGGRRRAAAPPFHRRPAGEQLHGRSRAMGQGVLPQRHACGQRIFRDLGIFAVDPLSGNRRRQSFGPHRRRALLAAGAADLCDLRGDLRVARVGPYPAGGATPLSARSVPRLHAERRRAAQLLVAESVRGLLRRRELRSAALDHDLRVLRLVHGVRARRLSAALAAAHIAAGRAVPAA